MVAMTFFSVNPHAFSDEIALIKIGEQWKYFVTQTPPPGFSNDWIHLNYNDLSWNSGPSGFGTWDNATQFPNVIDSYSSVLARKQFNISNIDQIKWLILRLDYQDGFIAYLNGIEVARRGFPIDTNNPVEFNRFAEPHNSGIAEEIDLSHAISLLLTGENILAIQLHRSTPYRSLTLCPELLANFTRGPFLQNSSTSSIQIVWKTPYPTATFVNYGSGQNFDRHYSDTNLVITHVATLSELESDTLYKYQIGSSNHTTTARSPVFQFRSFKKTGVIRFAVLGDTGSGTTAQFDMAAVLSAANPDLTIINGDILYPTFTAGQVDLRCISVYQPQMRTIPFFFSLGNHDRYSNYYDCISNFYHPTNSVDGAYSLSKPELYYSFTHGDALFIILDTDQAARMDIMPSSRQFQWLENQLATSIKPWKFIFFHNNIRSSGPHRFDDYNGNGIFDRIEMQQTVGYLAAKYKVQIIFNSHDHLYERLSPQEGVNVIVTGGGGGSLYSFAGEWDPTSVQLWSRHHCVVVNVDENHLHLQALGSNSIVFDEMHIYRNPIVRQPIYSETNYVRFENLGPINEKGNIIGQTFDFAGSPIPSVSGSYANLGQMWVNHDKTNLYLGFSSVMLQSTQNLLLFIDAPTQQGVCSVSPYTTNSLFSSDGVNALRALSNVSFTNFNPFIGVVLGDEKADVSERFFVRPNNTIHTGQGAYFICEGFPDIPSVRIQQFNRSPQDAFSPAEQNADFIKLSFPLSLFGDLTINNTLKIGVLVASTAIDTLRYKSYIDTTYLGAQRTGKGWDEVVLEGIPIILNRKDDINPNDKDQDGLKDGWEVANGLNPNNGNGLDGANGDPDQDGFTNIQEQTAGTDPQNRLSSLTLRMVPIKNALLISWTSIPGKKYFLEVKDNPEKPFYNVSDIPLTATTYEETLTISIQNTTQKVKLFRIRVSGE